jgi:hypothetical protein
VDRKPLAAHSAFHFDAQRDQDASDHQDDFACGLAEVPPEFTVHEKAPLAVSENEHCHQSSPVPGWGITSAMLTGLSFKIQARPGSALLHLRSMP